jgi:hypothetical protein
MSLKAMIYSLRWVTANQPACGESGTTKPSSDL